MRMNPRPRKCLEIARGSCGVLAARWSPASLGTGKDTGGSRDTHIARRLNLTHIGTGTVR